jgi:MFS transporter, DHA1 family, tetracycline resistance protein
LLEFFFKNLILSFAVHKKKMKQNRNASLIFILITIFIDTIGFGIIIPVIVPLIMKLAHVNESGAAYIGAWLGFSYAGMQFLFSPIMGGLSDRFGRRPLLLFSLLGLGIDYIVMGFAPTIVWLFLGRIIAGIMGASFTTAAAYIADISPPEKRTQNFGMIGVAFGMGFIVGPLIGSVLSIWGSRVPFFGAAVFTLLNLIYGYFAIPESLSPEKRREFSWKRANPIGGFRQVSKFPNVAGFLLPMSLLYIAHHAVQSNWNYYTIHRFHWNEKQVGYSLAVVGIMIAIVQGGLIRVIMPKLGQTRAVFTGMIFTVIGFTLFAFATQGWMMYVFLVPYVLGGLSGPAVQGILSNQVPDNAQGELQGISTSLMGLTAIIGPLLMGNLFGYFTSKAAPFYFPGVSMLTGALLTLIALFLTIGPISKLRKK